MALVPPGLRVAGGANRRAECAAQSAAKSSGLGLVWPARPASGSLLAHHAWHRLRRAALSQPGWQLYPAGRSLGCRRDASRTRRPRAQPRVGGAVRPGPRATGWRSRRPRSFPKASTCSAPYANGSIVAHGPRCSSPRRGQEHATGVREPRPAPATPWRGAAWRGVPAADGADDGSLPGCAWPLLRPPRPGPQPLRWAQRPGPAARGSAASAQRGAAESSSGPPAAEPPCRAALRCRAESDR